MTPEQDTAATVLRAALAELEHEEPTPGTFVVVLPGREEAQDDGSASSSARTACR